MALDVAYLSALSALAGSLVGGVTSGITTWLNQRAQARTAQLASDVKRREILYRDFITAASRTYGEAIVSSDPNIQDIVTLYAMISRMRIIARPRTVTCADQIMLTTIETYYSRNKTVRELRQIIKTGTGVDPLKEFSEAARDELHALRA